MPLSTPPPPPVSVVSCSYSTLRGDGGLLTPGYASLNPGSLSITFVNDAQVAATGVTFDVTYGGDTQTIREGGTFSHGAPISAVFATDHNPNNGSASCAVRSVRFSDGTEWSAG
ncbi:MAG TPA: hypothetical protein VGN14_11795 [Candidatus Elarobacter sp.]|jgi:hypothetical protein